MKTKIVVSIALFCVIGLSTVAQNTFLSNDPNIQYIGRFDNSNPLSPKISWTGTQIIANFEGTSLQMIMNSAPDTYYNVTIDDVLYIFSLKDGNVTYTLASGLTDTIHTVVLFKRDSPWNPQNFNGFILDDGKKLVAPPARKIRKIEFYGDSQTQGAQVEVPGSGADLGPLSYDNNYFTFGAITARAQNAEYSSIARCGLSLTPYTERDNLPDVYDRTGMTKDYSLWDFNSWVADVICINLGANDHPFPSDFSARYVSFVQKIRSNNPKAHIFLLSGPMKSCLSPDKVNATADAVKTLNFQGDVKVYHFIFNTTVNHSGHARASENQVCAEELVRKIKTFIW